MVRSMTGFGRCIIEDTDWIQTWEIRSVNSRYLDLKWRLPVIARSLEQKFEKLIRQYATRGRVEIQLTIQPVHSYRSQITFNNIQASMMLDALKDLAKQRNEVFTPNYTQLLTISSLWEKNNEDTEENIESRIEKGLITVLKDWNEARETEGNNLINDLSLRISKLNTWLDNLKSYAPRIKEERFKLLKERLTQALLQAGEGFEETRFLQEMVIHIDRIDISEELTRLSSHLEQLNEIAKKGPDIGRKLDFTLQECFREISTCGNKIQDIQASRIIVDFKNELEKCREQVQNLE